MRRSLGSLAVALSMTFTATPAQAQLTGSTLHLQFEAPSMGSLYQDYGNAVVGGGTEWSGVYFGYYDVDVAARLLTLTFDLSGGIGWCSCSFVGWHLSDFGGTAPSFSVSDVTGAPAPSVTWDNDNVWINMSSMNQPGNAVITMNLTPVATPEPASLALLATGLVSVAFVRRRRGSMPG
ncbi:hypothetical protein BH09GEM1_BH09GEM1_29030 [soil metagenome]